MFLLLVLLSGIGRLHAGTKPHKIVLQTTVPEKISTTDTQNDPVNHVAYAITIGGKQYFIHLKKQSFYSPTAVVYSYEKNGTQNSNPLLTQMDCSYHGYIAGFPNSLVSLNICSGLRGIMLFKNISYGIEPMESVSGFMHIIYEEKNDNSGFYLLEENVTYHRINSKQELRENSETIKSYKIFPQELGMYIVVDQSLFEYMSSDIKTVTQKITQVIGLANTMFTQLQVHIVISSIEIWTQKAKISTAGDSNDILIRFLKWQQKEVTQPHHLAYLFLFKENPNSIGATFSGNICDKKFDAGVVPYTKGLSLESYTVSLVQLVGINLGLTYGNNDTTCHCTGNICIMSPQALHFGGVKDFSTCDLDEFKYVASHNGLHCLHKVPANVLIYKSSKKMCGNGIREGNEECDCGSALNCTHKSCCDPETCRLKGKHSVCGSGECCGQNCRYKRIGTLCRKPVDKECDFTEYCNGRSSVCVPDTFVRNGQRCDSGDSYCYNGQCRILNEQCRNLVGGDSRRAPVDCFNKVNSRRDRYENCGSSMCLFPHALCGKLVCAWPHKQLVSHPNLSVVYTHIREETCVSAFHNTEKLRGDSATTFHSLDQRDETYVQDGSSCGPGMYCVRFQCIETERQPHFKKCDPTKNCQKHGICNNFDHCHCKKGFSPPYCIRKKGAFGSIDDGHLPGEVSSKELEYTFPVNKFELILFVYLPVCFIVAAALVNRKQLRNLCIRDETVFVRKTEQR